MEIAIQVFIGIITLIGVFIILFTKNIVHAAYALGLALIGIAGMYVLLNAELLAVVQILLYAGGVVILLSFGVMMTHRLSGEKVMTGTRNKIPAGLISISIFVLLCYLFSNWKVTTVGSISDGDQVKQIGVSFLTEHIVAFELIAFVLLVALVGAAYLAKMSSND